MLFRIKLLSAGFQKQPIKYDSPWITYSREASPQRKKIHSRSLFNLPDRQIWITGSEIFTYLGKLL